MKIQKWSAEATGGDNTGWSEYHHLYSHNIIDTQPIQSQENGKNKKKEWYAMYCRMKHDTTAACPHEKYEQVYIKSKVGWKLKNSYTFKICEISIF